MTKSASPTVDPEHRAVAASPGRGFSYRVAVKIGVPLAIALCGLYFYLAPPTYWARFRGLSLAFVGVVYVAVLLRGRWRDTMTVAAAVLFCLLAFEVYSVLTYVKTVDINTPGYSVSREPLGWGPEHPGVYHHKKIDNAGHVLVDVDYTIDEHFHRKVVSAAAGPTVAFFGGSDTFGIGISDADTLPQQFADATGRGLHVVNLAFSAFGPQQLLRGLELDLFADELKDVRLVVIQTAPWQAERTGCINAYIGRAPRYELVEGRPVFQGACSGRWPLPLRLLFAASSLYGVFVQPMLEGPKPEKLDLFVAILARTAAIARERYGAATVVLYEPDQNYLRPAGVTDAQFMQRLRDQGLIVIDGAIDQKAFPGEPLSIPGDGHPTATANRAWAKLVLDGAAGGLSPSR